MAPYTQLPLISPVAHLLQSCVNVQNNQRCRGKPLCQKASAETNEHTKLIRYLIHDWNDYCHQERFSLAFRLAQLSTCKGYHRSVRKVADTILEQRYETEGLLYPELVVSNTEALNDDDDYKSLDLAAVADFSYQDSIIGYVLGREKDYIETRVARARMAERTRLRIARRDGQSSLNTTEDTLQEETDEDQDEIEDRDEHGVQNRATDYTPRRVLESNAVGRSHRRGRFSRCVTIPIFGLAAICVLFLASRKI